MNRSGSRARSESNRDIIRSFVTFLEGWMTRQRHHLNELLSVADSSGGRSGRSEPDIEAVIGRVLSHYQQYYVEKSRIAYRNVLLLFGPPWLTRLERGLLWVAGFKPGLAVQLALTSVNDLTEEQGREIEKLRVRTRVEEKALNDEMARIQESVAAPPLLQVARRCLQLPRDGELEESEALVESIRAALEGTVATADLLRMRTALTVIEILTPAQGVKFLAAATRLQLQLHSYGINN